MRRYTYLNSGLIFYFMQTHTQVSPAQIQQFATCGYAVLRQAIAPPHLDIYATYALLQRFTGYYKDAPDTKSKDHYADVLGESLLLHLKPILEVVSGRKLYPTYSFLRIYSNGSVMEKHTDRPSCEISASMTLGYQALALWPLWVESRGEAVANALDSGDLLVYRGCDVPHWRDRFSGRYWIQMFFHYVDETGPFAAHKFDRRVLLGLPSVYRQPEGPEGAKQEDATR